MTHTYNIEGMTCSGCVNKVKSELLKLGDVIQAEVQLSSPQVALTMQKHIPLASLQSALLRAGNFHIREFEKEDVEISADPEVEQSWIKTYKPILIIAAYILGITTMHGLVNEFDWESVMLNFMAAFFIVFSFFKMLDLKGFADSYAMYDIIARHWKGWSYVYVILELALGLALLFRFYPLVTYGVTIVVMSISIVGVFQSVLKKQRIRCACLGTVFNLPMSTVTIMENGLMILMSAFMIIPMV